MDKSSYSIFDQRDDYTKINEIDCFGDAKKYSLLYAQSDLKILPFICKIGEITHRNFTYLGEYLFSEVKTDLPQALFYAPHAVFSDSRLVIMDRVSDMDNYLLFIIEDKDRDTHLFDFLLYYKDLDCQDNSNLLPQKSIKLKAHSLAEKLWVMYQTIEQKTTTLENEKIARCLNLDKQTLPSFWSNSRALHVSDYYRKILSEEE